MDDSTPILQQVESLFKQIENLPPHLRCTALLQIQSKLENQTDLCLTSSDDRDVIELKDEQQTDKKGNDTDNIFQAKPSGSGLSHQICCGKDKGVSSLDQLSANSSTTEKCHHLVQQMELKHCSIVLTRIDNYSNHSREVGKVDNIVKSRLGLREVKRRKPFFDETTCLTEIKDNNIKTLKENKYPELQELPPYVCKLCAKLLMAREDRHKLIYSHANGNPDICSICGDSIPCQKLTKNQVDQQNSTSNFKCDHCDYTCMLQAQLISHMQTHSEKSFQCTACGQFLRNRTHFLKHYRAKHRSKPTFKSRRGFIVDRLKKRQNCLVKIKTAGSELIVCSICHETFQKRVDFNIHMHQHKEKQSHKCEKCAKDFSSISQLADHQCSYSAKVNQCDICFRLFPKKNLLLQHQLTHSGLKPFLCPFCSHTCNAKNNMNKHIRSIHNMPNYSYDNLNADESVLGKVATKEFLTKTSLRKKFSARISSSALDSRTIRNTRSAKNAMDSHKNGRASQQRKVLASKTYRMASDATAMNKNNDNCATKRKKTVVHVRKELTEKAAYAVDTSARVVQPENAETFTRSISQVLAYHKPSHSVGKHQCLTCLRSFTRMYNLRMHMLTHSVVKPYACSLCPYTCNTKRDLNRHVNSKHADVLAKDTGGKFAENFLTDISVQDEKLNENREKMGEVSKGEEHKMEEVHIDELAKGKGEIITENFLTNASVQDKLANENNEKLEETTSTTCALPFYCETMSMAITDERKSMMNYKIFHNMENMEVSENLQQDIFMGHTDGKTDDMAIAIDICKSTVILHEGLTDLESPAADVLPMLLQSDDIAETLCIPMEITENQQAEMQSVPEFTLNPMQGAHHLNHFDGALICNICSRRCTSKSGLFRHQVIHTGEKPFLCPFCPHACNVKWNLNKHIRVMHKKHASSYLKIAEKKQKQKIIVDGHKKLEAQTTVISSLYCKPRSRVDKGKRERVKETKVDYMIKEIESHQQERRSSDESGLAIAINISGDNSATEKEGEIQTVIDADNVTTMVIENDALEEAVAVSVNDVEREAIALSVNDAEMEAIAVSVNDAESEIMVVSVNDTEGKAMAVSVNDAVRETMVVSVNDANGNAKAVSEREAITVSVNDAKMEVIAVSVNDVKREAMVESVYVAENEVMAKSVNNAMNEAEVVTVNDIESEARAVTTNDAMSETAAMAKNDTGNVAGIITQTESPVLAKSC